MNLCTLFLASKMGIVEAYEKKEKKKKNKQTKKREKEKKVSKKRKKEKKERGWKKVSLRNTSDIIPLYLRKESRVQA